MIELMTVHNPPLAAVGLTNGQSEPIFDWVVRVAERWLGADVAMVSFVDFPNDYVYFKAQVGMAEPWASSGGMRYNDSICQHLTSAVGTLVIPDISRHPLTRDSDAVEIMGVGACLGAPVFGLTEAAVGSICVLSAKPRAWDTQEIATLEDLAISVSEHVRACMAAYWLEARVAAAEAAVCSRADLIADVSHELRSPLNALLGAAGALALTELSASQAELLSLMDQAGDQLRQLTDNLLCMAQAEAGVLSMPETEFRPSHTVQRAIAVASASHGMQTLPVRFEDEIGADRAVTGSEFRISQVLNNLLDNALTFNPKGPVLVKAALSTPVAADADRAIAVLKLTVIDSGPGVADSMKDTIFERFRQGEQPAHAKQRGAGIGLAIARALCQCQGGDLRIADTPGGGATFTATFSVRRPIL